MKFIIMITLLAFTACNGTVFSVQTKTVEYQHEDKVMEGYLAYPDNLQEKRPAILVIHQWKGLGDYEKKRAEQLAELGYVAFAIDMYGKGIRPETSAEASKMAGKFRSDRELMKARAKAGFDHIKEHTNVHPKKIAAIGYCFGGGVALELARSGADLKGIVSFHGNLDTPNPEDAKNIQAEILVCHGAEDPHVPWEQVTAFRKEMMQGDVNWQLNMYGNAVHSFTEKAAGDDPSDGVAYNKQAAERSWEAMKMLFKEVFSDNNNIKE